MNVIVNERAVAIDPVCTLEQLLKQLDKPLIGSALAVNRKIISRSLWGDYILCEGDEISLFQAIAGG